MSGDKSLLVLFDIVAQGITIGCIVAVAIVVVAIVGAKLMSAKHASEISRMRSKINPAHQ